MSSAPYSTECSWCGKTFGLFTMPIGKHFCCKKCENEYRESKSTKGNSGSSGCLPVSVLLILIAFTLFMFI